MKICRQLFLLLFLALIIACSSNDESSTEDDQMPTDNVMKEKLDTIKKAEAVNQLIKDAAAKQDHEINEQSH